MILTSGAFEQLVEFAGNFAGDDDPVTFAPNPNGMLRVLVKGDDGYGEIEVSVHSDNLQGRFTVSYECLPLIASELGDSDYIQITPVSSAKFLTNGMEWWVNFREDHVEPPRVKQETVMHWDRSFSEILSRVSVACTDDSPNGVLDSIHIEKSERSSSMVATNGGLIVAHDNRWRLAEEDDVDDLEDDPVSVLVRKRHVPILRKVCESGMPVSIHIGITNIQVKSGRRSATLSRKGGRFPKWRNSVRDGSKGRVYGFIGVYRDDVDSAVTTAQMVSSTSVIETHRDGVALNSIDDQGNEVESVMNAEWGGDFGPVAINNEYLRKISVAWPEPDFKISYRGEGLPLEIGSVFFQSPMVAMMMPVEIKDEE